MTATAATAEETPAASAFSTAVAAVMTDTFGNAEVHAMIGPAVELSHLDDFDFPEELVAASVTVSRVVLLPGLGLPLPPVDPYSTGFAATLCSDLCLWLEELSEEARAARIEELKKMDAPAIESENNVARNYYLLNNLSLSNAHKETLWGGAPHHKHRNANDGGEAEGKEGEEAGGAGGTQRGEQQQEQEQGGEG
jgi:hypothetical protein